MTIGVQITAHKTEALLFFTLLQLTVIVLAARIGATVAVRIGQTAAVGEIIVGNLLGPSLFGWLAPDVFQYVFHSGSPEPMQMLSQIGLVLLMFQIDLEFDFSHLNERRNRKAMLWAAAASLIAPFALGYGIDHISGPFCRLAHILRYLRCSLPPHFDYIAGLGMLCAVARRRKQK